MNQKIIQHVDDLNVTQNELVDVRIINRVLRRLLENDIELNSIVEEYIGGGIIQQYGEGVTYENGKLVWVKHNGELYLMRKISKQDPDAKDDPRLAIDTRDYERYGWKNENEILDINNIPSTSRIGSYIRRIILEHQRDTSLHYFGELNEENEYGKKNILISDVSNADRTRQHVFFPNKTVKLESNDVILNGYYRIWDSGLIEYDITYRMGYCGADERTGLDKIMCNNKIFSVSNNKDNLKYFYSVSDTQIFNVDSEDEYEKSSIIGNTIQCNRSDYVNVYFADIKFPIMTTTIDGEERNIRFSDENYMIFSSDIMSNDSDTRRKMTMETQNHITYSDRSTGGFTAILVTYPTNMYYDKDSEGYNAKNGGLVSNRFHCHIVGRWEKI